MVTRNIGTYNIIEKIGEGGMGAVYRGIDQMLEREVAVKALRPELASQPEVVERFRAEAMTLAKLNHPNIAMLYSFLREGDDYFMVMEFVRGRTLDQVLKESGPMAWNRAIFLFGQALEGIDHAHRLGIIHRDIKPANIMLTDAGSIKVMDFGIARALGSARLTKHGSVVGTLEYISPEQVRGADTDARSDIYSLGVMLYELLTGRVPFTSENDYDLMRAQIETAPPPPRTFNPNIPIQVEQAIMRALAKKREARYQTAGEFRAVLLGALGAVTNPLANASTVYAAPKTRVLNEGATPASTAEVAVRASASSDRFVDQRPSDGVGISTSPGGLDKKTRVDLSGEAHRITGESTEVPTQQTRRPTLFGSFRRKHYVAAVILILAIAAATVALMRSAGATKTATTSGEQTTQEPSATDAANAPAQPEAAPAEQGADQAPAEQAADPAALPEGQAQQPTTASGIGGANTNKAIRQPTDQNAEATTPPATETTAAPTPEQPAQPSVETAQPAQQTPPPTAQPNETTANTNAAVKQDQKKSGGVGGFFKKIFGGGKKENKNEPKKP